MKSLNILDKVVWLTPYGEDKLWDPALRLRRVNVHNQFKNLGINSTFIYNCLDNSDEFLLNIFKDANIVVFTEHSARELYLMQLAHKLDILTIRDHSELMFNFPYQDETFKEADLIVCCSTVVAQETLLKGYKKVQVIPDMWEPTPLCQVRNEINNLKAVFMGSPGPMKMLTMPAYSRAFEEAGYELNVISTDNHGKQWDHSSWVEDYIKSDIAICPQDIWSFPGKSNVRVAQAMGTGYPIIASPLQSYKEALNEDLWKPGKCGIIAYSPEEWKEALITLKDPTTRLEMHKAAITLSYKYSPENIAKMWYNTMLGLIQEKLL